MRSRPCVGLRPPEWLRAISALSRTTPLIEPKTTRHQPGPLRRARTRTMTREPGLVRALRLVLCSAGEPDCWRALACLLFPGWARLSRPGGLLRPWLALARVPPLAGFLVLSLGLGWTRETPTPMPKEFGAAVHSS